MRTITNIFNVYIFDELSKEVQKKVIEDYKSDECILDINNDIFQQDVKYMLNEDFKRSSLDVYYSLSYCQGDGLYI